MSFPELSVQHLSLLTPGICQVGLSDAASSLILSETQLLWSECNWDQRQAVWNVTQNSSHGFQWFRMSRLCWHKELGSPNWVINRTEARSRSKGFSGRPHEAGSVLVDFGVFHLLKSSLTFPFPCAKNPAFHWDLFTIDHKQYIMTFIFFSLKRKIKAEIQSTQWPNRFDVLLTQWIIMVVVMIISYLICNTVD